MSAKHTPGPAFPVSTRPLESEPGFGHQDGPSTWQYGGMTMRDYFATHATTDDVAAQINVLRLRCEMGVLPDDYTAICRYMHADAMLRAREAA